MTSHEHNLILAAKAGDESAWRELLLRYRGFMARAVKMAIRKRRDRDDAWSWALEFLMRCVRKFDPQHPSHSGFGHYLYRSLMFGVPKESLVRGAIHVPVNGIRRNREDALAAKTQSIYSPNIRRGVMELPAREPSDPRAELIDLDYWISRLSYAEQEFVRRRLAGETHKQLSRSLGVHAWKYEQSILKTLRRYAGVTVSATQ